MKYTFTIVVVILIVLGGWYIFTPNSDQASKATGDTLSIVTSFYPLQFAAERIVGDLGTVTNVGEGRDPHDVRLTTQNVRSMQEANLVILQGADLEPWGDDMIEQLEANRVPVVIATAHIDLMKGDHEEEGHAEDEHGHEDEHEDEHHEDEAHEEEHGEEHAEDEHGHAHGEFDPHTWLDPVLFAQTVEHLAEAIVALDPEHAATYEANASILQNELAALDGEYTARLSSCTHDEVIVSHDAYGYVGDRYGFEVHAIAGLSTQDLPSATKLAELKEEAEEGVGAILLEENSVAAYGETLARETGLKTLSITPIAYNIPSGDDYLSLMRANLNTFATALACNE